jgi:uncharacterized protein YukJ
VVSNKFLRFERNKYCLESKVNGHAFYYDLKNGLHVIDMNKRTNDFSLWDIT